jgi:hypothetical protein
MLSKVTQSRRSLLKLFGLAPVAAPLAAKAVLDSEVGRLAGVQSRDVLAPPFEYSGSGPPISSSSDVYSQAADYVNMFGIPEFARENMRRNAGWVGALDPDIAAKRSWSMSVKILTQRERNFARNLETISYNAKTSRAKAAFQKLTGFHWPF